MTLAERSKAWSVFAISIAGVVVSIPIKGMDICVCVVLCVDSGLATGWSPGQGVLPTVYRIKKTEKETKAQQKGFRSKMVIIVQFNSILYYLCAESVIICSEFHNLRKHILGPKI
jgi:hypothetical protein